MTPTQPSVANWIAGVNETEAGALDRASGAATASAASTPPGPRPRKASA